MGEVSKQFWTGVMLVALVAVSCGPSYTITPPRAFKRFEKTYDFRFVTADGVMLKGREVENYPEADLSFWVDAYKRHQAEIGYVLKSETCFKTRRSVDGCTLTFVVPYGSEDWAFSETLYVVEDTIYLLEVAGPYDRYAKVEKDLQTAFETFDPGS